MVGFVAPLAVAVLGPATGQLLDSSPRQLALNFCAITQGVCITASGNTTDVARSHVILPQAKLNGQQCLKRQCGFAADQLHQPSETAYAASHA